MTSPQATADSTGPAGFDPVLRRLAIVIVLGAIMTILDTTIMNVAVDTLARDFKTSLSSIQWVLTGYTLALSMSIPLTGWAMQRFGAKTMWLTSLLLFISGSILCGMSWSVGSLIAFRVLQGIGAGMIMPIGQTMLAHEAGPQRMGRVMSVIAIPAMLAPILGPIIGGLILDHLSWRWMFYVNVPFCAVALIAAVRMLPADGPRNKAAKLDVLGLLLLSPGLAGLVYGLAEAGSGSSLGSPKVLVTFVGGLVLVGGFVWHALRKGPEALVDIRMFTNRMFSLTNSAMFVYVGALFGAMVLLPLYFQVVRGYTPLQSGLTTAPLGIGAMIGMAVSGRLTDKIGSRPLALTGLPIMLLGLVGYTQIHVGTAIPVLEVMLFVLGLGHGTMMPALMGGSYRTLERKDIPSATTASNVGMRVGSSFGVALLTVLLQRAIEHHIPTAAGGNLQQVAGVSKDQFALVAPKLTAAFRDTFWWAFGIAASSVIPIMFIKANKTPTPPPAEPVTPIEDTAPAEA